MLICKAKERFVRLESILKRIKKPKFDSFLLYINHYLKRDDEKIIEEKIKFPLEKRHQSYIISNYSNRFHNIFHLMHATKSQKENEPDIFGGAYLDDVIFRVYKKEDFFMAYSLSFLLDAEESYGSLIINLLPTSAMIEALEKVSSNPYIRQTEIEMQCKRFVRKIQEEVSEADFLEINLIIKLNPIRIVFGENIEVMLGDIIDLKPFFSQEFMVEVNPNRYFNKLKKALQKRSRIINRNIKKLQNGDLKDKKIARLSDIENLRRLEFGLRSAISWAIIEVLKEHDVFKDIIHNLLDILIENELLRVIDEGVVSHLYLASVYYNKELDVEKVVTIEGFEDIKGIAIKIADAILKNDSEFLVNYMWTHREVLRAVRHSFQDYGRITIRPTAGRNPEIQVDVYVANNLFYFLKEIGMHYAEALFCNYYLTKRTIFNMFFA